MITRQFWKSVLPAMISFAFSGVYAIVDGIFVGRNIGDTGLAAVNLAYPLTAFIQATGAGIGMAGAIWLAVSIGSGDKDKEKTYFGNTFSLLLIASFVLTLFLTIFHLPILKLFGASGLPLTYAASYIKVIAIGSIFQVLGTGLVAIIRNYDGAITAMTAMIAGFMTNVVLDWLFISVLQYGTTGAAFATIIGQCVTMLLCLHFLFYQKKCHLNAVFIPHGKTVKDLLYTSLSPLGLTLSPSIAIVILNKGAMLHGGVLAVACYAIINYVICVAQLLLQGIGDGSQPLLGRYYGAGDIVSLHKIRKLAFMFAPAIAVFCGLILYLTRNIVPVFFGASDLAGEMYGKVIPYFIMGLVCLAVLRVATSYFYATQKQTPAQFLIYGEPVILLLLVMFVLPRFLGINGVWLAVPITQICFAFIGYVLLRLSDRKISAL